MRNPLGSRDREEEDSEALVSEFYTDNKSKKLYCHFILEGRKEVGKPKRIPIYAQEVTHKKRTWPIEQSRILTDNKGFAHIYLDINDSSVLSFNKDHADKCKKCSGKMTVDAKNARDLVKRKTISALWSVDQLPMLLLIIMGIIMLVMILAVFILYGDNQAKDAQLAHYLKPPTDVVTK